MATKEEREAMIRPVLEQYVRKCKALGLSDEQIESEIIEVYRSHADKVAQRRASFRTIDGDKKTHRHRLTQSRRRKSWPPARY